MMRNLVDMTTRTFPTASAIAFGALLGLSAATASADETWSFPTSGTYDCNSNGCSGGFLGPSETLTSGSKTVNVSAWSIEYHSDGSTTGNSFAQADLWSWGSSGTGVVNGDENPNDVPDHSMDNRYGNYDFMLLDFGGEWAVTEVEVGWRYESTYDSPEMDVFYWTGTSDPVMAGNDLTDSGWELLDQYAFGEGGGGSNSLDLEVQTVPVNNNTVYSQYWLVAPNTCGADGRATSPCQSGRNDAMKLLAVTGVQGTTPPPPPPPNNEAPEPASVLLLGAAIPFLRRRLKRA